MNIAEWNKDKLLVVTLPNGSTRTLSISQEPDRRYWFSMCAVTSKIGSVKLCSGCKVVGYIGKEEQKEDWPKHKELCKILKKARGNKDFWTENMSSEEMRKFMEVALGRGLTQFEVDIITHPRTCAVTGRGDNQATLKPCRQCYCVVFCPDKYDEGMESHELNCCALRTAAEDYKNEITLGHQVQSYKPQIKSRYEALPESIEMLFQGAISDLVSKKLPGYQETELRYLTFLYTCPLTVLHGLENATLRGGRRVSEVASLTLHLVGTRIAELRHLAGWEIIAARLPKLRQLHFVFIGDETPAKDFPREFSYKGTELQNERQNLEVKYFFEPPKLYQDCAFSASPDAVVALDCGFKFYPTWRPAICKALSYPGCPLIFTEFTLEDQRDNLMIVQRAMCNTALEVCLEPQTNPFRSLRGVRCTDKTGNYKPNSVIYTNDYICVVRSKE